MVEVTLSGRLVSTPNLRETGSGKSATSRDHSRATSGRPPAAALDALSRLSPTGSRHALQRAVGRLRERDLSLSVIAEDGVRLDGQGVFLDAFSRPAPFDVS